MKSNQIELVQQSWQHIKPVAKQAGLLFYERLFVAAPVVHQLFKANRDEQAHKLSLLIDHILSKLDQPGELNCPVQQLGKYYGQCIASPGHYAVVEQCLIATLKDGLGNKWNDELEKAWLAAFIFLKTVTEAALKTATDHFTLIKE